MKQKIFFAIIVLCLFGFVNIKNTGAKKDVDRNTIGNFEPIAVIELFTSQGCSSCPPADKLLAKTINANSNKMVFALSFHVDYWNRLGWADPFSKAQFSNLQSEYTAAFNNNGSYTPQMVVNGNKEFVGSDNAALTVALNNALNTKAAAHFKTLTATTDNYNKIKVAYSVEGDYATAKLNIALVTLMETTVVKRGENGGSTLMNDNVVRQLVTKNANESGEIILDAMPNLQKQNTAIIAYIQQKDTHKIIGAAKVGL